MPLIGKTGRRRWPVRCLFAALYLLAALGAAGMVYPFLVMVSGAFKSSADVTDFDVVPAFLHDDTVLFRKHIEFKYNNAISKLQHAWRTEVYDFRRLELPRHVPAGRVADWRAFEASAAMPPGWYELGYMYHAGDRLLPWKQREFRARLERMCGGSLPEFSRRFGIPAESWLAIGAIPERITERRYRLAAGAFEAEYYRFKAEQPSWLRYYPGLDYRVWRQPAAARAAFLRDEINLQFIRLPEAAGPAYRSFLAAKYGDVASLNRVWGTEHAAFDAIGPPTDPLRASAESADWGAFVRTRDPGEVRLDGPEVRFREFLRTKYAGDLAALCRAHAAPYSGFDDVPIPQAEVDAADFLAHRSELRSEFLRANLLQVLDYVVRHGRALWNTAVYCALAIVTALTINPLAAYALSRFRPRRTYQILLFCMATMAFPAAVTMIPGFLMLKEMNLLNTFAALVLPGMANGFNIFLLKGFFDSLPVELYESAELDGATEWTLFWRITMALSKPILAVMALGAFTAAYGNFMFAFVLCPDPQMWTLMVFLYQLQINGHPALTFAALLLASLPTLLVFLLCQRYILQGIAVPVEK